MKKILFWIPVLGFILALLPSMQDDLPIDRFSMAFLGPYHGTATGLPIVLGIMWLFGVT